MNTPWVVNSEATADCPGYSFITCVREKAEFQDTKHEVEGDGCRIWRPWLCVSFISQVKWWERSYRKEWQSVSGKDFLIIKGYDTEQKNKPSDLQTVYFWQYI